MSTGRSGAERGSPLGFARLASLWFILELLVVEE
jgi:hypothetical protein